MVLESVVVVTGIIMLMVAMRISSGLTEYLKSKTRLETITKFTDLAGLFQYYLEKSYQIVYKDQILIYSLEATKPNDDQFIKAAKTFTNLVLKLLGPSLTQDLINLHGDEDTLLFNITEYFNDRYENDEIRSASMEEMMEKELDTE